MEDIRKIREKVGLTQTQIALQLNVDQTTVAMLSACMFTARTGRSAALLH